MGIAGKPAEIGVRKYLSVWDSKRGGGAASFYKEMNKRQAKEDKQEYRINLSVV